MIFIIIIFWKQNPIILGALEAICGPKTKYFSAITLSQEQIRKLK